MGDVVTLKNSEGVVVTCDESVALNMPSEWVQVDRQPAPGEPAAPVDPPVEPPADPPVDPVDPPVE